MPDFDKKINQLHEYISQGAGNEAQALLKKLENRLQEEEKAGDESSEIISRKVQLMGCSYRYWFALGEMEQARAAVDYILIHSEEGSVNKITQQRHLAALAMVTIKEYRSSACEEYIKDVVMPLLQASIEGHEALLESEDAKIQRSAANALMNDFIYLVKLNYAHSDDLFASRGLSPDRLRDISPKHYNDFVSSMKMLNSRVDKGQRIYIGNSTMTLGGMGVYPPRIPVVKTGYRHAFEPVPVQTPVPSRARGLFKPAEDKNAEPSPGAPLRGKTPAEPEEWTTVVHKKKK